ncbi:TonB-dependent siderophore receptor [Methylosinus sp. Sm6]|uniref:TonB-dependent siderophore receptor n=1 Tax=Methylosinus sp. Sm6 TaxID=2866948 RepID=UPI001C9995E9|nr:TonB-dependent siderophore receptor [Methylosinus sp. Sm6]MBY6243605.1 TonB-dependent siderophore receptor [Methylosinus sp. Sm6]
MFRHYFKRGVAAVASICMLAPAAARAQEALPTIDVGAARANAGGRPADAGAGAGASTAYAVSETSTATKLRTPIMETPLNIQVVPRQVLIDRQVTTIDEALNNISGVTVGAGGAFAYGEAYSNVFLRGFRTTTRLRNGFRIDAAGGNTGLSLQQFANVQSIEVLKGPAAILYGALEPGGVVNVVTNRPQETPQYSVQQQFGSYALYRTTASATGPASPDKSLLYRMDMSYENAGSFVDFGYKRNLFFAPVLEWNIDPRTRVTLELQYQDSHFGQIWGFTPLLYGRPLRTERSLNYSERSPYQEETFFSALSWSHEFDNGWSIRQQFSMNRDRLNAAGIQPGSIGVLTTAPGFGEFVLPSPTGSLVDRAAAPTSSRSDIYAAITDVTGHFVTGTLEHSLLVGGDYYRTHHRGGFGFTLQNSWIDLNNPGHPGTPFGAAVPAYGSAGQTDSIGFYVQDQIKLPLGLEVLGGARYQNVNQRNQFTEPTCFLTGTCALDHLTTRRGLTAQAVTPRVGLLWRPEQWISVYGNYTEGFSPNSGIVTLDQTLVAPSQGNQWEGGVKIELFEGRLRATGAYYHLVKTNIPIQIAGTQFFVVAGEARSQGPELDIQGEILPGWKAIATYANTDVIYTRSDASRDPVHPAGKRFEMTPRNTASLWSTYEFQHEALRGLKVGAGYTYRGPQLPWNFSGKDIQTPDLPGYGTVDVMAAYEFKLDDTKVIAQLNVKNLFDRHYYSEAEVLQAPTLPYDWQKRVFGAPRVFMGSLRAEF